MSRLIPRASLLLAACLLAVLGGSVYAQSSTVSVTKAIGQTATIAVTPPTTYTDGASIASGTAITYAVYAQACGTPANTTGTQLATGLTAPTWTTPAFTAAGNSCYVVTATIAGNQSGPSNIVEANVVNPTPNPPAATIS